MASWQLVFGPAAKATVSTQLINAVVGNIAVLDTVGNPVNLADATLGAYLAAAIAAAKGNNTLESPADRLISVLDMLEYIGFPLAPLLVDISEMEQMLKPVRSAGLAGPGAIGTLQDTLGRLAYECRRLGLRAGQIVAEELLAKLAAGSPASAIGLHLGVLLQSIRKELGTNFFLQLSESEAALYRTPFGQMPKTFTAFPSARTDITDASRSYALGLANACVFHCMGILQYGLYALAKELDVEFQWSIQLETWQNIIDKIEPAIKDFQQVKKSDTKDQRLKFCSEAAVQFRYFKDAWRNHVCHQRQQYDLHQAQSILTHVGDFMELLFSQLKEVPT